MNRPTAARRLIARVVSTIAAWLVAFLLVMAVLKVGGHDLATQSLAVRALLISGVVVSAMTTLVMPALSAAAGRWLTGPTGKTSGGKI